MERTTRQKSAIRAVIETAKRPLTPSEILSLAQAAVPQLSLATVYRNLKHLQEAGEIATVMLPGESARFESVHLDHHHHFHCRKCDRVFDIPGCVNDLAASVPSGFLIDHHEITLYGTCDECTPKSGKRRPNYKNQGSHRQAHDHSH